MKRTVWLRKNHKWLALIAGIQIFIWSISGLYMTTVDLDIIHGDHLVELSEELPLDDTQIAAISDRVIKDLKSIHSIELTNHFGRPYYYVKSKDNVKSNDKVVIIDGSTGEIAKTISRQAIEKITGSVYTGSSVVKSIELLKTYPSELWLTEEPVWQVKFDDVFDSTLYFHYQTGRLISKRTDLWRVFDFLWTLHIIEYFGMGGYFGLMFRILAIVSLSMAIFGSILLYYRLKAGTSQ